MPTFTACGGGGGGESTSDGGTADGGDGLCGANACPTGQVCQAVDGGPACVPACPTGQAWNGTACAPATLCAALACAAQGKLCEGEPFAACTRCDSDKGFVPGADGICVQTQGGCQSQADCQAGQYCLKLDTDPTRPPTCGAPPACVRLQPDAIGPAKAWDPGTQACVDCATCVGVPGGSGNVWPVTVAGTCICETMAGYYFDDSVGARLPRACDADGDGWVEYPARNALFNSEVALRSNARCTVRSIAGFALRNERGEERPVSLGELGLNDKTLPLFEPRALDNQASLDAIADRAPAYGSRRFNPRELNPLTKACVSPQADFNQDGLFDVEQQQSQAPSAASAWMAPFVKLAYFTELHEARYRPDPNGAAGTLVIAEKRRCDPMAFRFDFGDSAVSGYWRECERRRAGDYDPGKPSSDFGRFTCDGPTGSCPVADAKTLFDLGTTDPATRIPVHASCSGTPSAKFTGMHHGSQFRCVQFQDNVSTSYGLDLALLWAKADSDPKPWVASGCGIAGPESTTIPGGGGTIEAPIACQPIERTAVQAGQVGWALAQYTSYASSQTYVRGCINEGVEWPTLCPGMGQGGSQARGNEFSFGNLYCGCGREFGGPSCEIGCPGDALHAGGTPDPSWSMMDRNVFACDSSGYCTNVICRPGDSTCVPGRNGYWMCGHLTATEGIVTPFDSPSGGYSLREAAVPLAGVERTPLCQNAADCGAGYRVR